MSHRFPAFLLCFGPNTERVPTAADCLRLAVSTNLFEPQGNIRQQVHNYLVLRCDSDTHLGLRCDSDTQSSRGYNRRK